MVGEGFEPSKLSQQIYSLPPLTARESLRQRMGDYIRVCVKRQVEVYFIVLCFVFIVKNIFSGCLKRLIAMNNLSLMAITVASRDEIIAWQVP